MISNNTESSEECDVIINECIHNSDSNTSSKYTCHDGWLQLDTWFESDDCTLFVDNSGIPKYASSIWEDAVCCPV